jgi:hypothetical protein
LGPEQQIPFLIGPITYHYIKGENYSGNTRRRSGKRRGRAPVSKEGSCFLFNLAFLMRFTGWFQRAIIPLCSKLELEVFQIYI